MIEDLMIYPGNLGGNVRMARTASRILRIYWSFSKSSCIAHAGQPSVVTEAMWLCCIVTS